MLGQPVRSSETPVGAKRSCRGLCGSPVGSFCSRLRGIRVYSVVQPMGRCEAASAYWPETISLFRPQAVFPDFGVFSSADVPVSFRFGSLSRVKGAMPKRSAFCQGLTECAQASAVYGRACVHAPQCPKKEGNRVKERAVRCAAVRKGLPMRAAALSCMLEPRTAAAR